MTRTAAFASVFLVIRLSIATPCDAQQGRAAVEGKWNTIRAAAPDQLRQQSLTRDERQAAERLRDDVSRQTSVSTAADAVEPDDSSAAATVRRLAGAIKTNPEGTEAGVVVAPFLLADANELRGLELTFAALKNDFTRVGVSYTWEASPALEQVWESPEPCPVTDTRLKELDRPRDFYIGACTTLVWQLKPEGDDRKARLARAARQACGFDPVPPGDADVTMAQAISALREVIPYAQRPRGAEPSGYGLDASGVATALALKTDLDAIADWEFPTPTSCYTNKDVRQHIQGLFWNAVTQKFAISAAWDLFPRKYGFSPDDSQLPRGELKTYELRGDLSRVQRGTELAVGVVLGRARSELANDLTGTLGLSFSLSRALTLLKSAPLYDSEGRLQLHDGKLPPRFVVGVITSAQLPLDKPESQDTRFNEVKFQPHLDFIISETLSFRLGIPVRAEIVERKAKAAVEATETTPAAPAVEARRSLQWTVPVALVAVLKLN